MAVWFLSGVEERPGKISAGDCATFFFWFLFFSEIFSHTVILLYTDKTRAIFLNSLVRLSTEMCAISPEYLRVPKVGVQMGKSVMANFLL
jgi:hypothetical protein